MSEDEDFKLALKLQRELEKESVANAKEFEDYSLAVQLQEIESKNWNEVEILSPPRKKDKKSNLANESWELIDPTPDAWALFVEFNKQFFWGKLAGVEVSWSSRMTQCAGICSYAGKRSGYCAIRLSEPLLKLRPRKDLLETLLHEMIHAYLFVTHNNRDRDGHGDEFKSHMRRINGETGLSITIYHSFHDEVALYKTHWWKCSGPCQHAKPFYGLVKRSMNRAPGPNDQWWSQHQATCGGSFIKIKEPESGKAAGKSGKGKEGGLKGTAVGGVGSLDGLRGQSSSGGGGAGGAEVHGSGGIKKSRSSVDWGEGKKLNTLDAFVVKSPRERNGDGGRRDGDGGRRASERGGKGDGVEVIDVDAASSDAAIFTNVSSNGNKDMFSKNNINKYQNNSDSSSSYNNNNNNNNNNKGSHSDTCRYSSMNDLLKNLNTERMKRKRPENGHDDDDDDNSENEKSRGVARKRIYVDLSVDRLEIKGEPCGTRKDCTGLSKKPGCSDSLEAEKATSSDCLRSNDAKRNFNVKTQLENESLISKKSNTSTSGSSSNKVIEKSATNKGDLLNILRHASLDKGAQVKIKGFKSLTRGMHIGAVGSYVGGEVVQVSERHSETCVGISSAVVEDVSSASHSHSQTSVTASLPPMNTSQASSDPVPSSSPPNIVSCPICNLELPLGLINKHLDDVH